MTWFARLGKNLIEMLLVVSLWCLGVIAMALVCGLLGWISKLIGLSR